MKKLILCALISTLAACVTTKVDETSAAASLSPADKRKLKVNLRAKNTIATYVDYFRPVNMRAKEGLGPVVSKSLEKGYIRFTDLKTPDSFIDYRLYRGHDTDWLAEVKMLCQNRCILQNVKFMEFEYTGEYKFVSFSKIFHKSSWDKVSKVLQNCESATGSFSSTPSDQSGKCPLVLSFDKANPIVRVLRTQKGGSLRQGETLTQTHKFAWDKKRFFLVEARDRKATLSPKNWKFFF